MLALCMFRCKCTNLAVILILSFIFDISENKTTMESCNIKNEIEFLDLTQSSDGEDDINETKNEESPQLTENTYTIPSTSYGHVNMNITSKVLYVCILQFTPEIHLLHYYKLIPL